MNDRYTLIGPFKQLLTFSGLPDHGPLRDDMLPVISDAGVLTCNGRIHRTGAFDEVLPVAEQLGSGRVDLGCRDFVGLPGFIDAHTHICFAGSRAADYALRNSGKSYLEIAAAGGGIWDTVSGTRAASTDDLVSLTGKRATRHFSEGVTTIEVKSGYGLSIAEELRMLRAIREADRLTTPDLVATCLAAHLLPKDFPGSASEYLETLVRELLPVLLDEQLCNRVDAFVEKSAFSPEQIRPYLLAAQSMGFNLAIHADQFSTGGSQLAVELRARSADHLEASGDAEIALFSKSETVAVTLPGASMGLGMEYAPARKLLDANACLAIASDWNPGSAPMGDLLCQASLFGATEKLSHAEVFSAITFRAAKALGLSDRGKLENGMLADLAVFPVEHYREIPYHQGKLKPAMVIKNGICHHFSHDF